jgi:uncharacterized protein YecE (DUF72 family)
VSEKKADVVIGTSGYSFDDWEGNFYPPGLPKGKRLDFYKDHFKATEINSTYYRIPHAAVFYNIAKKVGEDFEFMVKTHRSFTHDRKDLKENTENFNDSLKPLVESGKLRGLMAQFPYSFKYNPRNLDYIRKGRELFGEIPFFVEFRHAGWDRPEVYEALRSDGIGFCCVDEPALSGLFPPKVEATTNTGYVRLHGRNAANWWGGKGDRYDYLYSDDELKEWKKRIENLRDRTDKIYLFFNNCHLGQAVRNARMFMELLRLDIGE